MHVIVIYEVMAKVVQKQPQVSFEQQEKLAAFVSFKFPLISQVQTRERKDC